MSATGIVTFSDETLFRIQPWVRRVRRIIGAIGCLARPQWFVKNVALVSAADDEPSPPPGVSIRPGAPDDAVALAPLIQGRESLAWRFTRGEFQVILVPEIPLDHNGKFRVSRSLVESAYDGIDWERRRAGDSPALRQSAP